MSAHTDFSLSGCDARFTLEGTTFEICCGSAGLSDALRCIGFQVHPIDHAANRHVTKVKDFVLDVANPEQAKLLESMLHHCRPCYVHLGLPCGTCSRARERPMPARLGGHMGPPPLRDAEHLLGLPNLRAIDQLKVDLANKLYKCAVRLLEVCMFLGCLVSIENPARSWLWALLALLVKETGNMEFLEWFSALESVYFDACAHGHQWVVYFFGGSVSSKPHSCVLAAVQNNTPPCCAIEWPLAFLTWQKRWELFHRCHLG